MGYSKNNINGSHSLGKKRYGYTMTSEILITIFNLSFVSLLILLAAPIFLLLSAIIRFKNTGSILYSGTRLGKNKLPFKMYKLRTLPEGSQSKIGAELLSYKHKKLTFFVKFLRDSRLDELPQLFNILKGEMDIIGPRPLRPEIYEKFCKNIRDYDHRFDVRPGLVGYSQLFTPHSSPKRIRALIDNHFVIYKRNIIWDVFLVSITIIVIFKKIFTLFFHFFLKNIIRVKILKSYIEKRGFDRIKQKDAKIYLYSFTSNNREELGQGVLIDIDELYFKIKTNKQLNGEPFLCHLYKYFKIKGRKKRKFALCRGDIYNKIDLHEKDFRYAYIVKYKPLSEFNRYMIDQYFLNKSIMRFIL